MDTTKFLDKLNFNDRSRDKARNHYYELARKATSYWDEYYYSTLALTLNKHAALQETMKHFQKDLRHSMTSVDPESLSEVNNKVGKLSDYQLDRSRLFSEYDEIGVELKTTLINFIERSLLNKVVANNLLESSGLVKYFEEQYLSTDLDRELVSSMHTDEEITAAKNELVELMIKYLE